MNKFKAVMLVGVLAAGLLPFACVTPARAGDVSERLDDRMAVHLLNGVTILEFINLFLADHPGTSLQVLDSIAGRPIYLLKLTVQPGTNIDDLELDLDDAYRHQLLWGEMLYENDSPEGGTGSTWVDGLFDTNAYGGQYVVPLLEIPQAQDRSTGVGSVVAVLDTGIGLLIAGDALNGNSEGTEVRGANPTFSSDMGTADQSVAKLATREFDSVVFGHGNPVEGGADDLVGALATSL